MTELKEVWVFSGAGSRFTAGVFSDLARAKEWISRHKLTGVLTKYPIDIGVYDWAIERSLFDPKKDHETSPNFIQKFTTASQEHYHFEDGVLE